MTLKVIRGQSQGQEMTSVPVPYRTIPIWRVYIISYNAEATIGPIAQPYNVCVYGWCVVWEPCTVFGIAPSLILDSFLCAKSRGLPVPR